MADIPQLQTQNYQSRLILRNLVKKLFNESVYERYKGNTFLKDSISIGDWETWIEIILKIIFFYFVLENYVGDTTERIVLNNKTRTNEDLVFLVIHLGFDEKTAIVDGEEKRVGEARIRIPNVSREVVENPDKVKKILENFSFEYGNKNIIYTFENGKQIKLNAKDKKNAIATIETLSPLLAQSWLKEGSIADNIYQGAPSKKSKQRIHYGLTGYGFKVTLETQKGNKYHKYQSYYLSPRG
jgi:hypothetical protein